MPIPAHLFLSHGCADYMIALMAYGVQGVQVTLSGPPDTPDAQSGLPSWTWATFPTSAIPRPAPKKGAPKIAPTCV